MNIRDLIKDFIIPKFKFALTSSVATAVDYGIYIGLTLYVSFSETVSHAISYSIGILINFILQKKFIFTTQRKLSYVFSLSVGFSIIGWMLSQSIFNFLIYTFPFFMNYDLLAKIIVTGTIFFYNFYTKRFSFEKKTPWKK